MKSKEKGSAFVLTILFILLLTTMSAGLYLYADKQSTYADANYTSVAAGYIAQAGIEAGKSALANQDMEILDTNDDGKISEDDFPAYLDSQTIGTYHGLEGKQGVGKYTCAIDAQFSDVVELDLHLIRDMSVVATKMHYINNPNELNRIYSFENCHIRLLQNGEKINEIAFETENSLTYDLQNPGTSEYNIKFENILNPFSGRDYRIEIGRTPIDFDFFDDTYRDAYLNRINFFPNGNPHCIDCSSEELNIDRIGANAIVLPDHGTINAYYILHVNDPYNQNVGVRLYYFDAGSDQSLLLIDPNNWGASSDAYAVLNFTTVGNTWRKPNSHPVYSTFSPPGPINPNELYPNQLILEVFRTTPPPIPRPIKLRISRGINTPLQLEYRMRSETMIEETCTGGDPDASDCCWYPDWPDCTAATVNYKPIISMSKDANHSVYTNFNADLEALGRTADIRVDQLYTITATGNVERASEQRQLLVTPLSFLDYARFVEGILVVGQGVTFDGQVYALGRIDCRQTGTGFIYFNDDVETSSLFHDPHNLAQFHPDADLHTFAPVQSLPDEGIIGRYRQIAQSGGAFLPSGDIFLGNYDYLNRSNTLYGFYFDDEANVARYYHPGASMLPEDSPYDGAYGPSGSGYTDLTMNPSGTFNGVIFVDGDARIWGKLSGRSLTIFVNGRITIAREIIMGTDELDNTYPFKNYGEGYPVHLGLVSCYRMGTSVAGDIVISKFCPRIMRIESALMSVGGTWRLEDQDISPGAAIPAEGIDVDRSHKHYKIGFTGSPVTKTWISEEHPTRPIDINFDGRITDDMDGWNEWNVYPVTGSHYYIWHLSIIGPIITSSSGVPSLFQYRSTSAFNYPPAGQTRSYKYDPGIKFNPPPFFPAPERSLRFLEWSNPIVDIPAQLPTGP